jgi:hypothetical protein
MSEHSKTHAVLLLLLVAALLSVGCSDDTVAPRGIEGTFELVPDSAPTMASTDVNFDWMVAFQAVLTETGGQSGATVDSMEAQVEEAQGGIAVGTNPLDAWRLSINSPSTRLEPNSTLTIDVEVFYRLESGGREALVDLGIALLDDNGDLITAVEQVHALP